MVARSAVLDTLRSWIGTREESGNNDVWIAREWGLGAGPGSSWCVATMHASFWHTGNITLGTSTLYVPYVVDYARNTGQAIEVEQAANVLPGDMVMYTWDTVNWPRHQPGTGDHIGMVEAISGWNITAIEGNTRAYAGGPGPDGVFRRTDRNLDQVICFWRPPVYDGGGGGSGEDPEDLFSDLYVP